VRAVRSSPVAAGPARAEEVDDMSFGEHLQRVVQQTPGCVNCTLMGFDGIGVETAEGEGGSARVADAHVEYALLATQMRTASAGLDTGELQEVCIRSDGLVTVLRPLTQEYLVAASFRSDGLIGKGRYLLRVIAPRLLEELR
jgi:hypothetical protein